MNNESDTQNINTQGPLINNVSNNKRKWKKTNQMKALTQSRKPDRLTYH